MKKIEAIVEPSEVEGVKEGLSGIGVGPVTVTEVRAFRGLRRPHAGLQRGEV